MKKKLIALSLGLSVVMVTHSIISFARNSLPTNAIPAGISGEKPFYFVENKGQFTDQYSQKRTDIDFRIGDNGLNMFVGSGSIHYQWVYQEQGEGFSFKGYRLDMELLGANKQAKADAIDEQEYSERYHSPALTADAASYKKIVYRDIYPNIDWVLYVKDGQLEYDFMVKPGGNVADIKIKYSGYTALKKNENGSIAVMTPAGSVTEQAPYSFQSDGKEIRSGFNINEDEVISFNTGSYTGILTIDPVLEWSTYYGGEGDEFGGYAVCTDPQGNVFMAGETNSIDNIATTGSHQVNFGGDPSGFLPPADAYLVKFNADGERLWATYYGGAGNERGWAVACDASGNVYLAGETSSDTGIAVVNSHQDTLGGGTSDAFLVKFNKDGVRQWGTYYGGDGRDIARSVACDPWGNVYLAGETGSTSGIATAGSHQVNYSNSSSDAFIARFSGDGTLLWGSYYGGDDGTEYANSVYCDDFGGVYLAGTSSSTNSIASPGSFKATFTGTSSDAFLAKFDTSGTREWATYYGGTEYDAGSGVSADLFGNVYLYGTTMSNNGIATPNSHQPAIAGNPGAFGYPNEAFLVRFDSAGNRIWSTYFGGESSDIGTGVACDQWGSIYMTGQTRSTTGIATANGHQTSLGGDVSSYLTKFDSSGTQEWGTYFGGEQKNTLQEEGYAVAPDNLGNVYLTGFTGSSSNIATPKSYQENYQGGTMFGGGGDAYLAKFSDCKQLSAPDQWKGHDTVCVNSTQTFRIDTVSGATSYTWILPDGWTGSSDSNVIQVTVGDSTGGHTITVIANTDCSASLPFSFDVFVIVMDRLDITVNKRTLGTTSHNYSSWQWYKDGKKIDHATDSIYTVTENGWYSVVVTNRFGCTDSASYLVNNITGIESLNDVAEQIKVYPNPAKNTVFLQSPVKINTSLYGIQGNLILKENTLTQLNVADLPAGLYLLKIRDNKGALLKVEKLVIIK